MRRTWTRALLALVTLGALAAAPLPDAVAQAVPPAVHATSSPVAGAAIRTSLDTTGTVTSMVVAGGVLWAAIGGEVDVLSTSGAVLTRITGLGGAHELVPSADGSRLYVTATGSGRIDVLDVASRSVLTGWTVAACPSHLARSGHFLFYSHGCSAPYAVDGVDITSGLALPAGPSAFTGGPPSVTAAPGRLVTSSNGYSPADVTSYAVAADGSLTRGASARVESVYQAALSPSGTTLLTTGYGIAVGSFGNASPYTLASYDSATLSPTGAVDVGPYPISLAWSADGARYAGSQDVAAGSDLIRVFAADGTLLARGVLGGVSGTVRPVPGTLAFSADGTRVYGIAGDYDGHVWLTAAATTPAAPGSVEVRVTSPARYGDRATVTVTVPGRAGAAVSVVDAGTPSIVLGTGTTNGSGVAVVRVPVSTNGSVRATVEAGLDFAAATSSAARYTVPARLTATVLGYSSASGGTYRFGSVGAVRFDLTVAPARQVTYQVLLQARSGRSWRTTRTQTFATGYDGRDVLQMISAPKGRPFRVGFVFNGDAGNSAAPTIYTKPCLVG